MVAEQQRGILDEHRVRIVAKLGQADDLEPGIFERSLISGVLGRGSRGVDRHALEMSQLAFGKPRADRAGEGAGHQALRAMISATSGVSMCAPGGGSSSSRAIAATSSASI